MKKRIIKYAAAFAFFIILITGCELIEECGNCSLVTYDNGVETSRTPSLPYCGDSYEEKKNDQLSCVGNVCTIWECD
jgi:hypothetical protein